MFVCAECGQRNDRAGFCGTDGAPLVESTDPLLGIELGRYRIARTIGQGGMGRVYLAVQPAIGSRVAIKVLSDQCARDPELLQRFFAEARAVNLIRHEHIVSVIDMAQLPDGRPYIVMEFVDGQTLARAIRGTRAPLGGIVQVFTEVLSALDAAHALGIVHRDLKPDNVLITVKGHAKVLDFGIAKLAPGLQHDLSPRTQAGALLGTPSYMAPEQISGAENVDPRTDVYAAGIVLFEAITGKVPFVGATVFDLMRAHLEETPPRASQLRPGLPLAIEQVIATALAKAPEQRFQSAAAMAQALHEASAELPAHEWRTLSALGDMMTPSPTGRRSARSLHHAPDAPRAAPGPRDRASNISDPPPPTRRDTPAAFSIEMVASPHAPTVAGEEARRREAPAPAPAPAAGHPVARRRGALVLAIAGVAVVLGVGAIVVGTRARREVIGASSAPIGPATPVAATAAPTIDAPTPAAPSTLAIATSTPSPSPAAPTRSPSPSPAPHPDRAATARVAAERATPAQAVAAPASAPTSAPLSQVDPLDAEEKALLARLPKGAIIVHGGNPDTTGKPVYDNLGRPMTVLVTRTDYDAKHFDPFAYIAKAQAHARALAPDAYFVEFRVNPVFPDGRADLSGVRDEYASSYTFQSPSGNENSCMLEVSLLRSGVRTEFKFQSQCLRKRAPTQAKCSLAAVWHKAIEHGSDGKSPAAISFNAHGWDFSGPGSFTIDDDCP